MAVRWLNKALLDIADITEFHSERSGETEATRIIGAIYEDIKNLAVNPNLGQKVKGRNYESWYALGQRYKIYYRRLGPRTIEVYRVWPSRRRPLDSSEIVPS